MNEERPEDGRKYHVGDHVEFTDDHGKKVPGVVHGVRYQQGRYELVQADHETPSDPATPIVPGTGRMELVKGTEEERHSFEYIMVHEHEHKAWHATEKSNQAKLKVHQDNVKKHEAKVRNLSEKEALKVPSPEHPQLETHPPLKQHVRIYEDD